MTEPEPMPDPSSAKATEGKLAEMGEHLPEWANLIWIEVARTAGHGGGFSQKVVEQAAPVVPR